MGLIDNVNVQVTGSGDLLSTLQTYVTKILKPNIVDGKNILTQEMVSAKNTKYVIKYDYELAEDITIPENCVLEFDGGSLNGEATITGQNTGIQAGLVKIFDLNVSLRGTLCIDGFYPQWFGAISDYNEVTKIGTDNSSVFQYLIDLAQYFRGIPIKIVGRFLLSSTVTCAYDFYLEGIHSNTRTLLWNLRDSEVFPSSNSMIAVAANTTAFSIAGRGDDASDIHANRKFVTFGIKNIKFVGTDIDTTTLFDIRIEGCPARPCYIHNCEFTNLNRAIYSNPAGIVDPSLISTIAVFEISRCNAYDLHRFIDTNDDINKSSITNLVIRDCVIEQNSEKTIYLTHVYGSIIIENCLLENEKCPIYLRCNGAAGVTISNNYFEENRLESEDECIPWDISGLNTDKDNLINLNCIGNYFVGNNYVKVANAIICQFELFSKFTDRCEFSNCYFSKGVDLSGLKLISLYGANLFSDLKTLDVCADDNICNLDILNDVGNTNVIIRNGIYGINNPPNSPYQNRTTNFLDGQSLSADDVVYACFYKKDDIVRYLLSDNLGRISYKDVLSGEGFAIVKFTILADTSVLFAKYDKPQSTSKTFTSMSKLIIDSNKDVLDVRIPIQTYKGDANSIPLSDISIEGKAHLYNMETNKPIWYDGTQWVDATGQTV